MLIPIKNFLESYHIPIRGVIHVGAHQCQEQSVYKDCGIDKVLWFDANPEMCRNGNVECYAVCDVSDTTVNFNITSFDASSSMLNLGKHSVYYPEIVVSKQIEATTIRLDDYLTRNKIPDGMYNMLSMDIQGAELLALKGLGEKLRHIDVIYTEVNTAELYEGCCLMSDLDAYLEPFGLRRVETHLNPQEWGDAIYVRTRVSANVRGGIGNQLFIFATLYAYAKRNNLKPVFYRRHMYHLHSNDESIWDKFIGLQRLFPEEILSDKAQEYHENEKLYAPIPTFGSKDVMLRGHFQCERYFADYAEEIKTMFRFFFIPHLPIDYIGIHVRRGDYIGNSSLRVMDKGYYQRALSYLPNSDETPKLVICEEASQGWAKENIPATIYQSEGSYDDLRTLISCSKGLILANSTFSWWGGYLNPYLSRDRIVFPLDYFTDDRDEKCYRYVVPGWIYLTEKCSQSILERMEEHAHIEKTYRECLEYQVRREFTPEEQVEYDKYKGFN